MKKLLVFGGTSDGRRLVEELSAQPIDITVCVASEYGRELLPLDRGNVHVLQGRLEPEGILALLEAGGFDCIADCTHPHAVLVTANILTAANQARLPLFRLLRDRQEDSEDCRCVGSVAEAASLLEQTAGNVLLTTGSKELAAYTTVPDFARRFYPRVLPTVKAISDCLTLGYQQSHIIAMQGPFSRRLNEALFEQFAIKTLVTKESGREGGFPEKAASARSMGVDVIAVARPSERDGHSYGTLKNLLLKRLEVKL